MIWRVCKWENGASTDFTEHLGEPIFYEDRLDERLDSGEFVLESMPTDTYGKAFPPKTKFRLEYGDYVGETFSAQKRYDVVVDHDDVEFYEGATDICCHRVTFIEASVVAQGMHVDNIALTYELQDVTLDYEVVETSNISNISTLNLIPREQEHEKSQYIKVAESYSFLKGTERYFVADFINSYSYAWSDTTSLADIKSRFSPNENFLLEFDIPKLYCRGIKNSASGQSNWVNLCEIDTITTIKVQKYNGNKILVSENTYTYLGGPQTLSIAKVYNESDSNDYIITQTLSSQSNYGSIYVTKYKNWEDNSNEYEKEEPFLLKYSDKTDSFKLVECSSTITKIRNVSLNISALTNEEVQSGYYITVSISCKPKTPEGNFITNYSRRAYGFEGFYVGEDGNDVYMSESLPRSEVTFYDKNKTFDQYVFEQPEEINSIEISNSYCEVSTSLSTNAVLYPSINFLSSSVKYNAYDFLRKALLTVDTNVVNVENGEGLDTIQYPIYVADEWRGVLQNTQLFEDMHEQKNLWEILIKIGYYLHAIPYLEFAEDDRFVLKFKKLGSKDNVTEQKGNQKITVFNSHNLSEYFSQFDAYATNIFSPQNIIEERLVAKTTDSTYLVSNNTAEIITRFPILEIVEMWMTYHGEKEISTEKQDITKFVFENSIYNALSVSNPEIIIPAKGNSLYYSYGDNKIQGLNYTAPSTNNDLPNAFKFVVARTYGLNTIQVADIKVNDFSFIIIYRTQDSLRLTNFRPDLEKFVRNSSYEKYPHHEQFYGQQDKTVDSERFSANLFGQLLRVGNGIYQCQEYTNMQNMKEGGDLIMIANEPYYVVEVSNEFYPDDIVLQKVTYSKNFNQLAQIVTIPSEPRFYEISERSKIRREIRINEFLKITADPNESASTMRFMGNKGFSDLKNILFGNADLYFAPNYAYTKFKADDTIPHNNNTNQGIDTNKLFPSSSTIKVSDNRIKPIKTRDYSHNIVPLQVYPVRNGIVFEWDMVDNFSAGDYVDPSVNGMSQEDNADSAYYGLQPLRYVDIFGRADLFSFRLFTPNSPTYEQIQNLPRAQYEDEEEDEDKDNVIAPPDISSSFAGNQNDNEYIALSKDNREELSFNYQINLLYDSDFISYPNLFGKKKETIKVAYLKDTQSLFENKVNFDESNIVKDDLYFRETTSGSVITISFNYAPNDIASIKSVVIYVDDNGARYPILARNVNKLSDNDKLNSWRLFPKVF